MDRLAELRERRALTLRELSEMSDVAADTINQIELGHRKARPSTLRKLAKALDVEVREFFEEPALPKAEAPEAGHPVGHPKAAEARKIAEGIELPPSLDSLNIVSLVRAVVLADRRRDDQMFTRAAESSTGQTIYGSVSEEFEHRLATHLEESLGTTIGEKRSKDFYSSLLYSGLLNSARRTIDLEEENDRLKEENAILRDQLQERERAHS